MTEGRYVFGYGSLVNGATHSYDDITPVRLTGWRRLWRTTPARALAFLSAEPAVGCSVHGVIARVAAQDWPALDAREAAYDRHDVTALIEGAVPAAAQVVAYSVPRDVAKTAPQPVLLSYLDVVVQGFLRNLGKDAAAEFFEATACWDGGIVNDRGAPRYPRAQVLTAAETAFVDEQITMRALRVRPDVPPA